MATANPVVESAAKSVQAANATPPADAPAAAAIPPEAEQQAFSPDTDAALDRRGSGTSTMPREWLDSTKVIKHQPSTADTFGALTAGDDKGAPADLSVVTGQSTTITEEEAAADESGIASGTALKLDEGETEEGAETEAEAAEEAAEETEQAAETDKAKDDKVDAKPDKAEALKQTKAIRRTALDAMRIEAEKRQLEQRLRDERKTRETVLSEKAALEKKLREAPVAERLRLIGIKDTDQLLAMQLAGEIPADLKEPEPAKVEPPKPVEDPEKAALAKRLADLEAKERQRDMEAQQAQAVQQAQRAAAGALAILSAPEVAPLFKVTLASGPEALADVMARAEQLWVASGSKPSDVNRHVIAAAKEAEPILTEQAKAQAERYNKLLQAAGLATPAPSAGKQPGPVIPAKTAKAKPNVAGKNLAARGSTIEDDLPLDPMMRDAIIKRERGWGGSQ